MKRILLSPLGLAAGVIGGIVGFVAANVPGAVAGAVVGWGAGAGVRAALPRPAGLPPSGRRRREPIDPFRLKEPWRQFVQASVKAQRRYREAVGNARSGPLRDRLAEVGQRVDAAVDECWSVAKQGNALTIARSQMKAAEAERELARLTGGTPAAELPPASETPAVSSDTNGRPDLASEVAELTDSVESMTLGETASGASDNPQQRRIESLRAQVASAHRVDSTIAATTDRLSVLEARLNETVARAHELSVHANDVSELADLVDEVDGVVGDLEALRLGLEETSGADRNREP